MTDLQATATGLPPYPVQPKLDVVAASRATWRVFRRQGWLFVALLFIPLLITIPVQLLQGVLQALIRAVIGSRGSGAMAVAVVFAVIALLVQYGAQFTCQLAALWGAARNLEGGRFAVGNALKVGFGRLLPYAGLFVILFAIVIVGLFLLVVPGIIAIGFLALAPAACVIERRGPIESIKRSVSLVTGNWWRSFGTVLLTVFLPMLGFVATAVLVYAVCAAIGMKALALILILPAIPFFIVLGAIGSIVPAVLFVELRALKEGRVHGGLAGVFD